MVAKMTVYVEGVGKIELEKGASLEEVSKQAFGSNYKEYLGARINNEVFHLRKEAKENSYIKFLDLKN